MFDLKRTPKPDPSWVVSGDRDTKQLYKLVTEMAEAIEALIDSGEDLSIRRRKISYADVGTAFGKNPAYINKRDTPNIYQLITSLNETLSYRYNMRDKSKRNRGTGQKHELDRMSRSELLSECKSRGKRIRELEEEIAKEGLVAIYKEAMNTQRFGNSSYVKTLESQLDESNDAVESLQTTVKKLKAEIISLSIEMNQISYEKGGKEDLQSKNPPQLKPVK